MKRATFFVLVAILLVGCEGYATYTPSAADLTRIVVEMPEGPTKVAVIQTAVARYEAAQAAQGTLTVAQAQAEQAQAELQQIALIQTAEAQSTITAAQALEQARQADAHATIQSLDARATTQALDALAAQQARDAMATTQAQELNTQATATAVVIQATATAQAAVIQATATAQAQATAEAQRQATSTMQASLDNVETTRQAAQAVILEATAQAVTRQTEIDESRQQLTTFGGWAILAVILVALVGLVIYLAPTLKARAQVVRRKHDETEPMIVTLERVTMPLRTMFPVLDLNNPQLPEAQMQDRTTARAQLANVVSAARGSGKRRVAQRPQQTPARTGGGVIEVVEPSEVRGWLDDARGQLIEGV